MPYLPPARSLSGEGLQMPDGGVLGDDDGWTPQGRGHLSVSFQLLTHS